MFLSFLKKKRKKKITYFIIQAEETIYITIKSSYLPSSILWEFLAIQSFRWSPEPEGFKTLSAGIWEPVSSSYTSERCKWFEIMRNNWNFHPPNFSMINMQSQQNNAQEDLIKLKFITTITTTTMTIVTKLCWSH